nr:hypothetical protein CFP56_10358 [Quercus suber]
MAKRSHGRSMTAQLCSIPTKLHGCDFPEKAFRSFTRLCSMPPNLFWGIFADSIAAAMAFLVIGHLNQLQALRTTHDNVDDETRILDCPAHYTYRDLDAFRQKVPESLAVTLLPSVLSWDRGMFHGRTGVHRTWLRILEGRVKIDKLPLSCAARYISVTNYAVPYHSPPVFLRRRRAANATVYYSPCTIGFSLFRACVDADAMIIGLDAYQPALYVGTSNSLVSIMEDALENPESYCPDETRRTNSLERRCMMITKHGPVVQTGCLVCSAGARQSKRKFHHIKTSRAATFVPPRWTDRWTEVKAESWLAVAFHTPYDMHETYPQIPKQLKCGILDRRTYLLLPAGSRIDGF